MESFRIDEIARRLLESLPPALRSAREDIETNFRAVLRAALGKLDLVTRDEFDVQTKVLERTRAKVEALLATVAELERTLGPGTGPGEGAEPAAGSRRPPRQ